MVRLGLRTDHLGAYSHARLLEGNANARGS